jgi:nitrous oxidase accessory protein
MLFHTNLEGNIVVRNDFHGNYSQVIVQGGGSATAVKWEGNFWDIYEGFDRTHSGIGDTPFELYAYADRLLADLPAAGFFRGTPVIETLDFLARLAPFSTPQLILRDPTPATRRTTNRTAG